MKSARRNNRSPHVIKEKENEAQIGRINLSSLVGIQMILTLGALIHAWTLQYRNNLKPDGFVSRISFIAEDKPWVPPGIEISPLLHLHYFGDWVLNVAYAGISRPYDPSLAIPAQFAPIGLVFFGFLFLLGYKVSYLLLLIATITIWYRLVANFFPNVDLLSRISILIFMVLLTMPSIIAFDRGGTQLFCIGLVGAAYFNLKKGKKKLAFLQYLLAVSLKTYLVFFLLIFLLETSKKLKQRVWEILKTSIMIALINIVALALFSDNVVEGLRNQINATARFAGDWGIPWIMDGASLTSFTSKTYEYFYGNARAVEFMQEFVPVGPRILAAIYLLLLLVIISSNKISGQIKMVLILSTGSLVSPFSGPYTLTWVSLAFCYLLSELQKGWEVKKLGLPEKVAFFSLLVSFYISITPFFGQFSMLSGATRQVPGNFFYVPFVVLALIISFITTVYKHLRPKPATTKLFGGFSWMY